MRSYPEFFDAVPPIRMHDGLAEFLGAVADGLIEYRYVDVVKLAGHSCPTVAATWGLTRRALAALYGAAPPERGAIRVDMRGDRASGVTGVVASVVALLTGASGDTGFKGIAGRFDRRDLLFFGTDLPVDMRFTRLDTGAAVDAGSDLNSIASDPAMLPLLKRCAAGAASQDEAKRFRALWQDRVRKILIEHADDERVFKVSAVRASAAQVRAQ